MPCKAALGNSWLARIWLRTFPTEFVPSYTETLVSLYSQGTHSGNFTFLFRNKCAFQRDPPHGFSQRASPFQLLCAPAAGLPHSRLPLPTLESAKWGRKTQIPCDFTLPHIFKVSSLGLQDTFPQGTKGIAAAKGSQILFYPHIHGAWRLVLPHAILIPPDNTSSTGSAENLTKSSCQSTTALTGNWAGTPG